MVTWLLSSRQYMYHWETPGTPVRGPIQRPVPLEEFEDDFSMYSASSVSYPSESETPGTGGKGTIKRADPGILGTADALGGTGDEETDEEIDENFARDHLSDIPLPTWWSDRCDDLVGKVREIGHGHETTQAYGVLCELLNHISDGLHASLDQATRPKHAIAFIDHHSSPPMRHPEQRVLTTPTILAVDGPLTGYMLCEGSTSVYERVPWHHIVSCVELNTSAKPRDWLSSSVRDHMTARPDMPGVYGLAASPGGYTIMWSDACGIIASPLFAWDSDCGPLVRYVYSLYVPPPNHFTRDPSVEATEGDDVTTPPHWTIRACGKVYTDCQILFLGSPWGRRTVLWVSKTHGETTVIKDTTQDAGKKICEGQLLAKIHGPGQMPGVVRLVDWCFVQTDRRAITTAPRCNSDKSTRRKLRLVLGSFGTTLRESKSVLDLLKAVYDAIEVHRFLSVERNILHRDMSINNVLMYPKHHEQGQKQVANVKPKFIDDVLGDAADPADDNSRCLLIDWDHSSGPTTLLDHDTMHQDGAVGTSDDAGTSESIGKPTRTGTPTYIARSIAAGRILDGRLAFFFEPMPVLQGKAKDLYFQTYGEELYESFTDTDGKYHGGTVLDEAQEDFLHRPRHDVESVFWTLLSSILRVTPKNAIPEHNTSPEFANAISDLDNHIIAFGRGDSRLSIIDWMKKSFQNALHPDLGVLTPMLDAMCSQIRPEYAYLSPPPRKEHLHEAMRRLLLQQIVDMGSDAIELDPHVVRVPIIGGEQVQEHPRVAKRMIETGEIPGGNKKMRKE